MIRRCCEMACAGIICSAFGGAFCAETADVSVVQHQADFVVAGMRAERDQLRSCKFRAKLKKSHGPKQAEANWKPDFVITGLVFCACDFEAGKVRFDRQETGDGPGPTGGKYIRTPEKTLHAYLSGYIADIKHPSDDGSRMVKPFDVRVVGLTNPQELEDVGWSLEKASGFYSSGQTLVSATQEELGLHEMTWICGKRNELKRSLWVNERRGFTPERLEISYLDKNGDWQGLQSVRTVWKQASGVWIPEAYSCDSRQFYGSQFELVFDWESINGEVETTLFSQEGLSLREDTLVVDNRLDKPFIVERIGVGKRKENGGYARQSGSTLEPSRMSTARLALTIISAAFLLALLVVVSLRYRKRAT